MTEYTVMGIYYRIITECLYDAAPCFMQEVKEFLGDYKAKNILISKKFKHGM